MNKRRLAHAAWRGCETAGEPHSELIQFFFRFEVMKLLDDRGDRVFFRRIDNSTALELVRIDVPDERAQSLEMLAPRGGLIVIFDKRYRHKSGDYTDIRQIL